ncbi:MAG: single-stranded DNA-binding protein [Bacteroidales bacterium]|jgi:single-strand DNA-binding protein|nr:single-stranded DNA-binding protein [Lentimicrobiaceae bacterium]MDG1135595.1 single-stranded DNA-binding protein [Bacteroidales bacterium]MDG1901685.1 single-stranded DNA-binding protein [Bacteroidales bacterium]MDG2081785.1 single-stranded DNA-binding protein [Bacteroidales bacterium]|tara:strand:- start:9212 stop:9649 length:438 start_codon:yes stop_codon:yes gene_type:complete
MAGINKVMLIGHIGKDPDVFTYEDGTKRISFPLATTESYKDKNTNEWVDQTEWHNIVGYRYLAEKRIAKGDLIYVEGKIKTRKYKDKDANDRYITEILAEKINMMAHPKGYDGGSSDNHSETPKNSQITSTDADKSSLPEDDLPF